MKLIGSFCTARIMVTGPRGWAGASAPGAAAGATSGPRPAQALARITVASIVSNKGRRTMVMRTPRESVERQLCKGSIATIGRGAGLVKRLCQRRPPGNYRQAVLPIQGSGLTRLGDGAPQQIADP